MIANGIFEMISGQRIASQSEINESRGELDLEDSTLERILTRYDKEYGRSEHIHFSEEES